MHTHERNQNRRVLQELLIRDAVTPLLVSHLMQPAHTGAAAHVVESEHPENAACAVMTASSRCVESGRAHIGIPLTKSSRLETKNGETAAAQPPHGADDALMDTLAISSTPHQRVISLRCVPGVTGGQASQPAL